MVSQRMTGSAFATAKISTTVSGINNFSPYIKVFSPYRQFIICRDVCQ